MNPPEVDVEVEEPDIELILEYTNEILEMAGEVIRQFTEEELETLEIVGRILGQWEEFEFVEYE